MEPIKHEQGIFDMQHDHTPTNEPPASDDYSDLKMPKWKNPRINGSINPILSKKQDVGKEENQMMRGEDVNTDATPRFRMVHG